MWALPVVLPGFVERAVGSEAAERPTETRETQREEEEHHGKDEEEDDEQGDPDRIGLWAQKQEGLEAEPEGRRGQRDASVPAAARAGPLSTLPP